MNPTPHEWVEKGEADFVSAQREYRARKDPNYDAACFHAQQCVEKYIKGCLLANTIEFPKTHDLIQLASILPSSIALEGLREGMARLSAYAVEFRYPGESADRATAKESLDICKACRVELRDMLELPDL